MGMSSWQTAGDTSGYSPYWAMLAPLNIYLDAVDRRVTSAITSPAVASRD